MTAHSSVPPEGRRARKRRETDTSIALAGVKLALEKGYENVTVDAICDVADVSRSTFFNYYPSRDAAIIGRSLPRYEFDEIEAAFSAHPRDLVRGVVALTAPALEPVRTQSEFPVLRARLVTEQPEARRQYSHALIGSQQSLNEATLTWLRAHPETGRLPGQPEREAALVVTAAYAIMHAMTEAWSVSLAHLDDAEKRYATAEAGLRSVLEVRS